VYCLSIDGMDIGNIIELMHSTLAKVEGSRLTALKELQEEEGSDPLKILIGTVLSARTRDENTKIAVSNLFSRFKDAIEIANADVRDIEMLIRPAGFYRVKARRIKEIAKIIVKEYNCRVPDTLEELLRLPGVGRKTANCVLVYAFDKPAIPVDTHVHRISNRLGIVDTVTPEDTERALTDLIEESYWKVINDTFVRFGQNVCKPIAPSCDICMLKESCKYYNHIKGNENNDG
jgi:endonuclease-3